MDSKKVGDWKIDSLGRRYRIDEAGVTEYAMTIQTTAGIVYADELEEHNRRLAESKKKTEEEARKNNEMQIPKVCPFKAGRIRRECVRSCSFYGESSCRLSMLDAVSRKDTEGLYCPISGRCEKNCAMYSSGCTLIELIGANAQKGKV